MKKIIILLSVLMIAITSCGRIDFDKNKLDTYLDELDKDKKAMGSLSIYHNDKEVYAKSIGYASIEDSIINNRDTKYRIAHLSQIFTAVMALKLIEQKRLTFDTPFTNFYPKMQEYRDITVKDLLRNAIGIKDLITKENINAVIDDTLSHKVFFNQVLEAGMDSNRLHDVPKNNNSGYLLLSLIIQKVIKKPYDKAIKEGILKVAKLKNTYLDSTIDVVDNESFSYVKKDKKWVKSLESKTKFILGSLGLSSTPQDVNLFLRKLFTGVLLKDKTLDKMLETVKGVRFDDFKVNYGLGLFKMKFKDMIAYGNSGSVDGYFAFTAYFPTNNVAISWIGNGGANNYEEIVKEIINIYFAKI